MNAIKPASFLAPVLPWVCVFTVSLMLTPPGARATEWHEHSDIQAAAVDAVRARTPVNSRVEVVADSLDARVRLVRCAEVLSVSLPPNSRRQSTRVTAEVRCQSPRPWKIYVPVRLTIFQKVVVAARALPRGTVLTADDISLAEEDIGALGYGYLSAPEHAIGHRLRRALDAGTPLSPGALEMVALVRRGQRVTLEAKSGGLTVRMAGIARSNGIRGQVIDVENVSSRRLVQAIVRSAQSAEVLLP